jgi:DNA polymerase III subunit delta'
MELVLHSDTKQALDNIVASDAHAIMLVGPSGSGKQSVAQLLAERLLEVGSLENQAGLRVISPQKGSIGIDEIRQIQRFLRLKTTGQSRIRRVLVITDAQQMTIEAQNAFLKLLEEPPEDTRLVLTVASGQHMLTTIYSRVQVIHVKAPSKEALVEYFISQGKYKDAVEKAYLLGGGQIGLMAALLNDQADHPLIEYVDKAKQFLGQSSFERLAHLDNFAKSREELALLLEALKRMSSTAFEQSASQNKESQSRHWHKIRRTVLASEKKLAYSPNVKLLLTDLSLNL